MAKAKQSKITSLLTGVIAAIGTAFLLWVLISFIEINSQNLAYQEDKEELSSNNFFVVITEDSAAG